MEKRGWHDYNPDGDESKDEQLESDHVETECYMKMEKSQEPLLVEVSAANHNPAAKRKREQSDDQMNLDSHYDDLDDDSYDDDDNDVLESDTDIENGIESSHGDDLSCLEGLLEETQDVLYTTSSNNIPTLTSEFNGESSLASTSTDSTKTKSAPWWMEIMEKCKSVVQTDDGRMTILKCCMCQKVYLSDRGLKYHIRQMHDKSKPQATAQANPQANSVVKTFSTNEVKRFKMDMVN